MAPRHPRRFLAVLALLALLVGASACSDDDDAAPKDDGDDEAAEQTDEWAVDVGDAEAKEAARDGAAQPALQPFIALLCRSAGNAQTYAVTPERIQSMLVGEPRSIDGYLREMSLGRVSIAGSRAAGWFDLPRASSSYPDTFQGMVDLTRDCAAAATAGGVDLNPFSNVMVFLNDVLVDNTMATSPWPIPIPVGGQDRGYHSVILGVRGLHSPPLVLHELAHVMGGPAAKHTNSSTDPMGGGANLGDRPDAANAAAMRTANIGPGYDASLRDLLGWIPAERKVRYGGGTQQYALSRLTQPVADGPLLVDVPIGSTTARYVVSARTRTGYDAQLITEGQPQFGFVVPEPGVVIEKVDPAADTVRMLSVAGARGREVGAVWRPGQTFEDAANGIRITIDRFDDTGAQVTVTGPGGAPPPPTTGPASTTTTTAPAPTSAPQTAPAEATTTVPATPAGTTPTDAPGDAPTLTVPATVSPVNTVGKGHDGEPRPCGQIGATVWLKVTMPASGQLTISTVGSDFDTVMAFYGDGSGEGNLIECIDDAGGPQAATTQPLQGPPGGTLYLQVGGFNAATGNLAITLG